MRLEPGNYVRAAAELVNSSGNVVRAQKDEILKIIHVDSLSGQVFVTVQTDGQKQFVTTLDELKGEF